MKWVKLSNGIQIPAIGYGTFQIKPEHAKQWVLQALQAGYRLIDTAASYFNEKEIGEAIRQSGIPRNEIFLTTKVWIQDAGYEKTLAAFEKSLERLQTDYIDLYLIHQPYGDYYGSWKAMEKLYEQVKIKAIGVCNFDAARLVDLTIHARIAPMVDQVEFHPLFQERALRKAMPNTCVLEAWGPLNEGQRDIFHHRTLKQIARKHDRSVAQVILRWHVEQGGIAIPKAADLHHMEENLALFDFELDQEDKKQIEALDFGYSELIDHANPMTVQCLNRFTIHE